MLKYTELKPKESEIEINGKIHELKPFSLAIEVWAHSKFATKEDENGVMNLAKRLENIENLDIDAVCEVVFKLLYDKSDFKNPSELKKAVTKRKYFEANIISAYNGLVDCIGISQPQIDEVAEKTAVKKWKKFASEVSTTASQQDTDIHLTNSIH